MMYMICGIVAIVGVLAIFDFIYWVRRGGEHEESVPTTPLREVQYEDSRRFVEVHDYLRNRDRNKMEGVSSAEDVVPGKSEEHWLRPFEEFYEKPN